MTYSKEYQKEMNAYEKSHKKQICDILCNRAQSTFDEIGHNMQVEDQLFVFSQIKQEIEEFERAELQDNIELERKYGRANKKR